MHNFSHVTVTVGRAVVNSIFSYPTSTWQTKTYHAEYFKEESSCVPTHSLASCFTPTPLSAVEMDPKIKETSSHITFPWLKKEKAPAPMPIIPSPEPSSIQTYAIAQQQINSNALSYNKTEHR